MIGFCCDFVALFRCKHWENGDSKAASKRPVRLSLQQMLDGLWDEKDDENLEEGLSDDDEYVGDYEDENGS